MNGRFLRYGVFCSLLAAGLLRPTRTEGASLTLVPGTISSSYSGQIALQGTELTNGETILLERFLDPNTNGVIDPGELLVQSFRVTDGQVTAFSGVRDTNIPGDDDGESNGRIETDIFFNTSPEFGRGAGNYLFRLSSPSSRFEPVVQSLVVTQAAFAQQVTGQVTSGGSPVANASVALLVQSGDDVEFVTETLADGSGNFSLSAATGSYLLLAAKSGFVSDLRVAPFVTFTPGQTFTQNLTLRAPSRTISGRVIDAASGIGVPGLQLFVESANDAITFAFTDTNGTFTASVLPDQWKIDMSDFSLSTSGYLRPQNNSRPDTTAGDVTGVNIQLAKETALIYGTVKNDTNAPLPGISLSCNDNNNQYQSRGITDATGNYFVGATAGTWFVGPDDNNPALMGYLLQSTNVTLTDGQALQINFVARRSTAHLMGRIVDSGNAPVSDLTIIASTQNGGSSSATSATDGGFDLGVFGGSWTLQLETTGAAERNLIGPSLTFTVTDGVNLTNLTYVAQNVTAQINGFVRDSQASGVAGVFVYAIATNLNGAEYHQSARTDGSGNYQLGVINGSWQVGVDCFDLNNLNYTCPDQKLVAVAGANQTANFTVQQFSNTPPTLSQPQFSPLQFRFRLSGEEGRDYRVDATTNFLGWITLGTFRTFGGSFTFIDPNAGGFSGRFYRAVLVP